MDYRPLFDKVLVKQVSNEHKVGGLYIPDTSTNLKKGIVIAAGRLAESVKPSDEVLFTKDIGTVVTIEGEQYLVISEKDIWLST